MQDCTANLNALTSLSDELAESLSRGHKGRIELNGLLELSDNTAAGLSKNDVALELNGLARLTDLAAENLSRIKRGLCLDGLRTSFTPPIHKRQSRRLSVV